MQSRKIPNTALSGDKLASADPEREGLMRRLERAQATGGNRDHNVIAGAALLNTDTLRARVEEAEKVADR